MQYLFWVARTRRRVATFPVGIPKSLKGFVSAISRETPINKETADTKRSKYGRAGEYLLITQCFYFKHYKSFDVGRQIKEQGRDEGKKHEKAAQQRWQHMPLA